MVLNMSISLRALEFAEKESGLAEAYKILSGQWKQGERDRELGLLLFFISWYAMIEPGSDTGFGETDGFELKRNAELNGTLRKVHAYFEPKIFDDVEMLYVIGLAAHMFYFMFDDSDDWEKRGILYREKYRKLAPNGIDPEIFSGRGFFGEYYKGQARAEGGY